MTEQSAEETIKELARLVRKHVDDLERRHYMINLLSSIGATLYTLREELQVTRDITAELLEAAAE